MLQLKSKDLSKLVLVGDRILIKPSKPSKKTSGGLFLPQGMAKEEELYSGYVMKVGPGYPIPAIQDVDEPWKEKKDNVQYVPLQPKEGDLAVYLQNRVYKIEFNKQEYVIVPHQALLMLVRDDDMPDI